MADKDRRDRDDRPADDDEGNAQQPSWADPVAETASNFITALAGFHDPQAGATAAMTSPVVRELVQRTLLKLGPRWDALLARGAHQVLQETVDASGLPADELEEQIAATPQRLLLAGSAIQAGSQTVDVDKLRALGRALATGLRDDAQVDVQFLVVAALADMEVPHVRVLREIAGHVQWSRAQRPSQVRMIRQKHWMSARDLAFRLPGYKVAIAPILATLERHGLVTADVGDIPAAIQKQREYERNGMRGRTWEAPAPQYDVTDFGLEVLRLLVETSREQPD